MHNKKVFDRILETCKTLDLTFKIIERRLETIQMTQARLTQDVAQVASDLSDLTASAQQAIQRLQDQVKIIQDGGDPDQAEIDAASQQLEQIHTGMASLKQTLDAVPAETLTVLPNPGTCNVGGTINFSVKEGISVDWSVAPSQDGGSGGSIEPNGVYTAGPNPGVDVVTAKANDGSNTSGTSLANVTAAS